MTNRAAVLPTEKVALESREIEVYVAGSDEILVKNKAIAFSPFEMKIAKRAILPIRYPAILGSSCAGTVEGVGPGVTSFKVGDRVAVSRGAGAVENRYGTYQRYLIAQTETASKIPAGIDLAIAAGLVSNLSTVVGLFSGSANLAKPSIAAIAKSQGKKILIYGGSSNLGSLSVQYVARSGYEVITTSSPKHQDFVSKLGASNVIDHTQPQDAILKSLIAEGPYELVVDTISVADTMKIAAEVVAAQNGRSVYAMQPAFGPETLPVGIIRDYQAWRTNLNKKGNEGLLEWAFSTFFPAAIQNLVPTTTHRIDGGLQGVNEALDKLEQGVSGVKLVVDPWE